MSRLRSNPGRVRAAPPDEQLPREIVLPRGDIASGQLVLPRGAARTTLIADPALHERELLAAEFGGPPALVQVAGARVTVRPQHASLSEWVAAALLWGQATTTLRLSTAVAWTVAIKGGASRVTADLRALRLTALQVTGGVSEMTLDLPQPVGRVEVQLTGGVQALTLRRPEAVAVHLILEDAGSRLALDARYLPAVAGPVQLTAGAAPGPHCYVVRVRGGASRLSVDTWKPGATPLES